MDQWRASPRRGRAAPVIATGHQPTLWHPGILAKDLAADALAKHLGGTALHVVVDHNALAPLSLDIPTQLGGTLGTRRVLLDTRAISDQLPPNRLVPIDSAKVAALLTDADAASRDAPGMAQGLARLAQAYLAAGEDHEHLAAQTSAVLAHLMQPVVHQPLPTLSTSTLVTQGFVDRLLADPLGCVRCYNRAVAAYPHARIRPLHIGRDSIEAPLWAQDAGNPAPVYIDLGDTQNPQLYTELTGLDLTKTDAIRRLRPRAATLSAIMRSDYCDLMIHGKGGGAYDNVTERWWRDWTGEELAPKVIVTADMMLGLDAPLATRDELERAVWFDHHLPFNVDRYAQAQDDAEASLEQEKRTLLDHMNDDRDKRRRAVAFKRIHAINAKLQQHHRAMIEESRRGAARARLGVDNAAIAHRRDWCFALYSPVSLRQLAEALTITRSAAP